MPEINTKDLSPIVVKKSFSLSTITTLEKRYYYKRRQSITCPPSYVEYPGTCPPSGLYGLTCPTIGVDPNPWIWYYRLHNWSCDAMDWPPRAPLDLPPSEFIVADWYHTSWPSGSLSDPVFVKHVVNGKHVGEMYSLDTIQLEGSCVHIKSYFHYYYDDIAEIRMTIDGNALRELINDLSLPPAPEGHAYVLSGFEFSGGSSSFDNDSIVEIEAKTGTLEDLFNIAYHSGTNISGIIKINPNLVNVANPACSTDEASVCGGEIKVKIITYYMNIPTNATAIFMLESLTQKDKPLTCNKCEGLKTIITDTGDQTQICSPITCSTDSDCPEGCMCVDGECQPIISCSSDNDCPEGQVCVNGKCVDEEEQKEDEQDISSDFSIGINHITYEDDALDILYIPSNLAVYDAKGTYIGDAPYDQIDGIVVSTDGVFYYPHVRISRISDSFSEAGIMEFTQYAKFDDTPYFKEGQLVYGVLYGQVLFGGFINDISYTISEGEQLIKYTAVSFRKDFEEAPWVFNYRDYDITTTTVLSKIINAAPRLFCRGRSGSLPKQTISEVNFTNQTIGEGLSYLFSAAGTYAWHLGPDKIFRIYNLRNLPIENIYVAQEGNNLSDHSEYKVVSMELNYNLSDRITRLIIRGDFKRDKNNNIIEDSKGNPTYLIYDTGWKGTAYTQFNIQHTKTLIESRFKYIEGQRDDTPYMKQYANLYLKPLQDAYIGGSITLEGILTNFSIGKAVKIYNTNLSYLNNQTLVIMDVEYDLDNKITRLSLSSNYWFGTDITKYFATIEERVNAIDRKAKALEETKGELQIAAGKITQILSGNLFLEGRLIKISSDVRTISIHPATPGCSYYNVGGFNQLKVGDYIQVHYRKVSYNSPYLSFPYNKAFKIFKIT